MAARGAGGRVIRRLMNTARIAAEARRQRRVPHLPVAGIQRLQRRRARRIVRHAWETVPFWRSAMEERGLEPGDFDGAGDLRRLPLIEGQTVRLRPEAFRSAAVPEAGTIALRSSGSARGVPREIHWDARSQLLKLAYAERDRPVLTGLAGQAWGQRQLWIFPAVSTSLAIRRWWDERILVPRSYAHRETMTPDLPYEQWIERLDRVRPVVVYSYGSVAERFFRWLAATGRSASLPRVWVYGGDAMSADGRAQAEARGCRVLSAYQSVEAGRIGFECERRVGFHLNVDLCDVRVVDAEGRDVPAGTVGEVVVSNLFNRATVLFNLRTGDRAALEPEPCPCGRTLPLLSGLEGRTWETIRLATGGEIGSTDFLIALKDEVAFALQFQIVHPEPGRIVWRVVPADGSDAEEPVRRLEARTRAVLGPGGRARVELVRDIPPDPSGKWRLVVTS
jgi:phenylacetate-CoA ligase